MLSKSKKNTHIKFLMGTKLSKGINIEAHSASESVIKNLKGLELKLKLLIFPKIILKLTKKNHQSPT